MCRLRVHLINDTARDRRDSGSVPRDVRTICIIRLNSILRRCYPFPKDKMPLRAVKNSMMASCIRMYVYTLGLPIPER